MTECPNAVPAHCHYELCYCSSLTKSPNTRVSKASQKPRLHWRNGRTIIMLFSILGVVILITSSVIGSSLRVVENSGVCGMSHSWISRIRSSKHHPETTPGVYQASGYVDVSSTKSFFFWFFAARNNAATAPLSLWFNGGPGVSSMGGIVQEHGPCRITNDSSALVLNPNSWNTYSNMLYIDQPIGAGFSTGDITTNSSKAAAIEIWNFMQAWLADERFQQYANSSLALWAESWDYSKASSPHLYWRLAVSVGILLRHSEHTF